MTTQNLPKILGALLLGACSTTALQAAAADTDQATFADALKSGKVAVSLRYRLESVDQDNLDDTALASTLKSRINWTSGTYRGFGAFIEMDDVTAVGDDDYNSTVNGNVEYPVVADPEGTEVNQAYIQYRGDNSVVTAGRQRINLDGQRFVGGVGWRQNEQTYDGYRYQYGAAKGLQLDYSYVYNVNRIFGEDSGKSDLEGDIQLFHATYPVAEGHKVSGFLYELDLDNAVNASSRTIGVDYKGAFGPVKAHLSYANQTETGDSALDYSVPYYLAEVGSAIGPVNAKLGYEVLGADNGTGFATPLATLHKYQGFTDKFLATPGDGVEDLYVGGSMKVGGGKLGVTYHTFTASESSADYGSEIDISYGRKLTDGLTGVIKYASYSADDYSVDTDKVWLMLTASF
ncbi:alginate export family protein [Biformimicrobium ophioploci]|uniref:Alginate export family protein n=1 Tax=Biformimicrobium ophioploci TaxID=3036711 RepID=A0ABQ6M069_9GAMM|nr:alginate export family protein [Microbulbifer sp. NKW57]GMG87709.1 alginate export family protein [Microbulbifer sp. NKW57]